MESLEDKIKDLEKEATKWKARTADMALALSLLSEANSYIENYGFELEYPDYVEVSNWIKTRWEPGLLLLKVTK